MNDGCLTPTQQFFRYIMVNFQWDDDEVHFFLDQHAELDFYSVSSLKQQTTGTHVALLGHIILIQSQQVFFSSPDPKGHVSYCHHLASVVVVRRTS